MAMGPLFYISPCIISLFYYAYVFLGCEFFRRFGLQYFEVSINGRLIVNEFFGTLQLCLCLFETSLINKYYGVEIYFLCLCLIIWIHTNTKRTAYANPSPIVEDWLIHKLSTRLFLMLIASECVAAYLAYSGARAFWKMSFSSDHLLKLNSTFCHTDLKVPLAMGLVYEALATFVDRIVWLKAESIFPQRVAEVIGCVEIATVTLIGVELTGMYFNPILASAATFGCIGLDSLEHSVVYWLGPILGWMIGTRIHAATVRSQHYKNKSV